MSLRGTIRVPGDKSISHRALILGSLCEGSVDITGLGTGDDVAATERVLGQLGVPIMREGTSARIYGVGLDGMMAPTEPLDCGNSGTTMRLMLGVLAGQPFEATLIGDESLSRRPMKRVLTPLQQMGLEVLEAKGGKPPLRVKGTGELSGIAYQSPIASAQVKSAVLLAGLRAGGETTVNEPARSRDHTERLMAYLGTPLCPRPIHVPGDLSSAAFLLAAALLEPGSQLTIEGVGINPTRTGFLDVIKAMGGKIGRGRKDVVNGEPAAELTARHQDLRGAHISGQLALRAIDELPLIATLAARARGVTEIRDAAELRVKESDRISRTAEMLQSFGVDVEEHPDGLTVHGDPFRPLSPGDVDARGDHRIAMCAALLARLAGSDTRITGADAVTSSFPEFHETLAELSG
ncbi:MAG: 3-phosphoshikimate 1-carboxyvinyltransferase [Myxococcota bacterium]|nr:3-phosphoshikimate 1-carboxyvinyltransferase [Myxococcota bacterium]